MKHCFFVYLILLLSANNTVGQVVVTLASGTSTTTSRYISPYTNNYDDSRKQFIITAAELIGAGAPRGGLISTIGFRASSAGANCTFRVTYGIKHTTLNNFGSPPPANSTLSVSANWDGGFTTIYSSTNLNSNSVNGWRDYSGGGTFCWDGISNIMVQLCSEINGTCASGSTTPNIYYNATLSSPCYQSVRAGSSPAVSGSYCTMVPSVIAGSPSYNFNRPHIRFTIIPTGACPANGYLSTDPVALCQVLPVSLVNFDAVINDDKVMLNWATTSEINNDYFTIERSSDGVFYEELTKVKGAGQSNSIQKYQAMDLSPIPGVSYYRLKQTNFNNISEYSRLVSIDFERKATSIDNIYPNPTNNNINFDIYSPFKGPLQIDIIDYMGRVVTNEIKHIEEGNTTISSKMDELSEGIYFLKVSFEKTGFTSITKVIKN